MTPKNHILKMPNLVSGIGAFSVADKLNPRIFLVSIGSIIPSSQSLKGNQIIIII